MHVKNNLFIYFKHILLRYVLDLHFFNFCSRFLFCIKSIYFFLYTLRIYFSPDGSLKVFLRYIRHKTEFVIDESPCLLN